METIKISSVDDLRAVVSDIGDGALYRGQVRDYRIDGRPSATTSFDRNGCIPSEMAKWCRYASLALSEILGSEYDSLKYSQALLQHYGWRSFYIDASSDAAVAAWFASHGFKENIHVEMCEDYQERPICLRKQYASYKSEPGDGHLYILDKEKIETSVGCIDLSVLSIDGHKPRFVAQSALIIGPLRNQPLPSECYKAHIVGKREIFKRFAELSGYHGTNDIFPPPKDDPVLQVFLSLPWKQIPSDERQFRAFRRTIEFPEYQDSFRKFQPVQVAFYTGDMISNIDGLATDPDVEFFGKVPQLSMFGVSNPPSQSFPRILDHLGGKKIICFEIDQLIGYSSEISTARYGKGVFVSRHEDNLYQLGEIIVDHPGLDLVDAGLTQGWFYNVNEDGIWARVEHKNQCQCSSDYTHEAHLSALSIIENYLSDPSSYEGIV